MCCTLWCEVVFSSEFSYSAEYVFTFVFNYEVSGKIDDLGDMVVVVVGVKGVTVVVKDSVFP